MDRRSDLEVERYRVQNGGQTWRMKGIWYRTEVRLGGLKVYGTDRRSDLEDERYRVQIGGQTWRMKGIWYRSEVRPGG